MFWINSLLKMKSYFYRLSLLQKRFLNIYKLKKHFKRGLAPLLCVLFSFNFLCLNVNAENLEVNIPISEPYVSDTSSYVVARTEWQSFVYIIDYYYAQNYGASQGVEFNQGLADSVMTAVRFTDANGSGVPESIYFDIQSRIPCQVSIYLYRTDTGVFSRVYQESLLAGVLYQYSEKRSNDLVGFTFNGKFSQISGNGLTNNFVVNWGNQVDLSSVITYLRSIDTSLNNIESSTDNIEISADNIELDINSILSSVSNIEKDTDSIMKDTNDFMKRNESQLSNIINILTDKNEEYGTISDVNTDSMNSVSSSEKSLLASSSSVKFDVDTLADLDLSSISAIPLLFTFIENFTTGNEKVFFMYYSILVFGVVALIFNRN